MVNYNGMTFNFKDQNGKFLSLSDIDLEIRDVYEASLNREPTEEEIQAVFALISNEVCF